MQKNSTRMGGIWETARCDRIKTTTTFIHSTDANIYCINMESKQHNDRKATHHKKENATINARTTITRQEDERID